jgi:hypothetical protein
MPLGAEATSAGAVVRCARSGAAGVGRRMRHHRARPASAGASHRPAVTNEPSARNGSSARPGGHPERTRSAGFVAWMARRRGVRESMWSVKTSIILSAPATARDSPIGVAMDPGSRPGSGCHRVGITSRGVQHVNRGACPQRHWSVPGSTGATGRSVHAGRNVDDFGNESCTSRRSRRSSQFRAYVCRVRVLRTRCDELRVSSGSWGSLLSRVASPPRRSVTTWPERQPTASDSNVR